MISVAVPDRNMEEVISYMLPLYGDSLLRMCFLYLKDIQLAEDAVQETFIKIYKSYPKFKGDCEEKTWVTRIAVNVCKNYLRGSWRKRIDENAVLENIPAAGGTDSGDDTVLAEIMKLSHKYKDVVLLYYYQEMKIREIAGVLRIPQATVSTRLDRARKLLKSKLKGWYYDE